MCVGGWSGSGRDRGRGRRSIAEEHLAGSGPDTMRVLDEYGYGYVYICMNLTECMHVVYVCMYVCMYVPCDLYILLVIVLSECLSVCLHAAGTNGMFGRASDGSRVTRPEVITSALKVEWAA